MKVVEELQIFESDRVRDVHVSTVGPTRWVIVGDNGESQLGVLTHVGTVLAA